MSMKNRVIWREGLFIKPQHFQQQQRHQDYVTQSLLSAFIGHYAGLTSLVINDDILRLGRVGISEATGVMPDGTLFSMPSQDELPPPIDITGLNDTGNNIIYLALPLHSATVNEIATSGNNQLTARYKECRQDVRDLHTENGDVSMLNIAKLSPVLKQGATELNAYVCVPICRISEQTADGGLILDESFIPSCLNIRLSPLLTGFLDELSGILAERARQLAERIGSPGQQGIADVAEFMMLQLLNRASPRFSHFAAQNVLHPEPLFRELLSLCGELHTFTDKSRQSGQLPKYNHQSLSECYPPLMRALRQALSVVLTPRAIAIHLQEQDHGIRVATIQDQQLLQQAEFIVAVRAQIPQEQLRRQFTQQTKITSVNRIRDLVSVQLPGVPLISLSAAPRQLPYHAGYTYFCLDRQGSAWQEIQQSGSIAFHVSGNFPELDIQFWAIRNGGDA
ncbi:MAG TPA: type VI secretion system baseplate subunit TssK [Morganella sp. (in: Bacteria)]|nr:type VI secretion system baseplate subunit TssK [Morganella sp. (in: enterobacteria)]